MDFEVGGQKARKFGNEQCTGFNGWILMWEGRKLGREEGAKGKNWEIMTKVVII
jgi:hypothetical protein